MIMEWKKIKGSYNFNGFEAKWQGVYYVLYQSTDGWHMTADGRLVKQSWRSLRDAMTCTERIQQRLVLEASRQWQASHGVQGGQFAT